MDFKRIEIIFLGAFFSLNIFLLFTYYQSNAETSPTTEITNFTNVEQRLREEKISYDKKFSREKKEGYYLSGIKEDFKTIPNNQLAGQLGKIDNGKLVSNFQQSRQFAPEKNHEEEDLKNFIRKDKNIIKGSEYHYMPILSELPHKFVFTQRYEGIPINDESSELVLNLEDAGQNKLVLKNYTQTYIQELEPLRESQEIISEREAITTLYMSTKIPKETKIIHTKLAYTKIFTVRGQNVYIPAWFVWIENKNNVQVERVNGFTNSVISASVPEVKK